MEYIKERETAARKYFQNYRATVVQRDENFFILDWRGASGFAEYFIRYILDIKCGTLFISGDFGSCIANWYKPVWPERLAECLKNVSYFVDELQCSSDTYIYLSKDIKEDLDAIKARLQPFANAEEIDNDFDKMFDLLNNCDLSENTIYPDELMELIDKYDSDECDYGFDTVGQRISQRVILWEVGYRMAMQQLKKKEKNENI